MSRFIELDTLEAVADAKGKNEKRSILKANANNQRLHDLLDATFNYKRKYYIKKWDQPTAGGAVVKLTVDLHDEFLSLLNDLESQKYRGDTAKQMVESFMAKCNGTQRHWYSKVILRDLKAGFGVDSSIDSGFKIPLFEVQLAKDGHLCKKLPEMLKNGLSASRKLDGYRCLAIVDSSDESVTLYTRNGEEFANFPSIVESLKIFMNKKHNAKYVFDGEIMSDGFQAMQKTAFSSKSGKTVGDVKYHIFDMIPYSEWISENFVTPAFDRYNSLETLFAMADFHLKHHNITNLCVVERKLVTTKQEILDLEVQYITEGYEGVMVNPNIPYYKGKHSNRMLKFKTFESMDCEVVSPYLGKPDTKYSNTLGGFTVMQENNVLCDVGSGYDDSERDDLWKNRDSLLGRTIEVKYQNLSDDDKRMRFPIFVRWRPDKDKK